MPRVLVVGAGIAGLATATFLSRGGFDVTVAELRDTPPPGGAGIQLSPNATKVLLALGIRDAVVLRAVEPQAIDLIDGATGRLLSTFDLGSECRRRYNSPYLLCERAVLRDVIADNMPSGVIVDYGADVLADGPDLSRFDAVIGADGVHSRTRGLVQNAAWPRATGRTAWRVLTVGATSVCRTRAQLFSDEHAVCYPMGSATNRVWIRPSTQASPGAEWTPWTVLEVDPMGAWVDGKTVLIGDAAHAMAPYAAQGGAMALEDAASLAACMIEQPDDLVAASRRYVKTRRPRIVRVARLTSANRRIYHASGPVRVLRNLAMRSAPQAVLQRRMAWVYDWSPPAIIRKQAPSR